MKVFNNNPGQPFIWKDVPWNISGFAWWSGGGGGGGGGIIGQRVSCGVNVSLLKKLSVDVDENSMICQKWYKKQIIQDQFSVAVFGITIWIQGFSVLDKSVSRLA